MVGCMFSHVEGKVPYSVSMPVINAGHETGRCFPRLGFVPGPERWRSGSHLGSESRCRGMLHPSVGCNTSPARHDAKDGPPGRDEHIILLFICCSVSRSFGLATCLCCLRSTFTTVAFHSLSPSSECANPSATKQDRACRPQHLLLLHIRILVRSLLPRRAERQNQNVGLNW